MMGAKIMGKISAILEQAQVRAKQNNLPYSGAHCRQRHSKFGNWHPAQN
jgi:hypothetical protein